MDYENMALLSLTSLWWFSTSQYGLPYQPSGPSQPSFGLNMIRMVQPRIQPLLMLSSITQCSQFLASQFFSCKEVTLVSFYAHLGWSLLRSTCSLNSFSSLKNLCHYKKKLKELSFLPWIVDCEEKYFGFKRCFSYFYPS